MATGYYGIHKIVHTLSPDSFTTTINGIIQMSEKDKDRINSEASAAAPSTRKGQPADESDPTDLDFADIGRGATAEEVMLASQKWEIADHDVVIKQVETGLATLAEAGFGADHHETMLQLQEKMKKAKEDYERFGTTDKEEQKVQLTTKVTPMPM